MNKNFPTDKYAVIFRDQSSWNVTSNYDNPKRALEAAEAFRNNLKTEAYAVNLRILIENVPGFVLSQVERAVKEAESEVPG
jgi:hypothetical protein